VISADPVTPDSAPALQMMPALPADTLAVLAMVRRCSSASLYHRFHGPTDGLSYTNDALHRVGDIIVLAWEGERCVGMAQLGGPLSSSPHLGVLVEDNRQRRGIGTRLVMAVASEGVRRGIRSIHADILGEDGHLLASLRRLGLTRVDLDMGTYSVDIELTASDSAFALKLSAISLGLA
jgi:GNAT superfamily N-acetyltransferase